MKTKNTLFFFALFAIATFSFVLIPWGNNAHALYQINLNGDIIPLELPPPNCTITSWTPLASTVCSGTSFLQVNDCGDSRMATGTKTCAPLSICTFDPANTTTMQNGLIKQWLSGGTNGCMYKFVTYMNDVGVTDAAFTATATLSTILQGLNLPVTNIWNMIYPSGNIFHTIQSKLQGFVCQIKNKLPTLTGTENHNLSTHGFPTDFSLVMPSFHLDGNPFQLIDACGTGNPIDTTPPTVSVTLLSQTTTSYLVQLVPHDNVAVQDASYNIGSAASASVGQHFTSAIQITIPKDPSDPVYYVYWWAKDTSGNENTGNSVLGNYHIRTCLKWGNVIDEGFVCVGGRDD